MSNNYCIKSRVWIEGENGTFLAEGRIHLLKSIIETNSISKAAKTMKMSYRKAWELVDKMNGEGNEPSVISVSGGKNGGGTKVTEYGKKMIDQYEALNKKCHEFLDKEITKLKF